MSLRISFAYCSFCRVTVWSRTLFSLSNSAILFFNLATFGTLAPPGSLPCAVLRSLLWSYADSVGGGIRPSGDGLTLCSVLPVFSVFEASTEPVVLALPLPGPGLFVWVKACLVSTCFALTAFGLALTLDFFAACISACRSWNLRSVTSFLSSCISVLSAFLMVCTPMRSYYNFCSSSLTSSLCAFVIFAIRAS